MAITHQTLKQNIVQSFRANNMGGSKMSDMAGALAQGIMTTLPSMAVQTVHVGASGAGTGTGKISLDPSSGVPILTGSLQGVNINGAKMTELAKGITQGVAKEFNSNGQIQVAIAGTSTGTGTGSIVVPPEILFQSLMGGFVANQIMGVSTAKLARGLANGLSSWMATGAVSTQDVGTPTIPATVSTGTGTGKIF